jgi:hypothetical protein
MGLFEKCYERCVGSEAPSSTATATTAGLAAHGVLDFFHGRLVANPGVPPWWPAFCRAFDVAAAG